ncbi:MAG: GGDEF domain-containing protein [Pseudomonadota bacterium]
MMKVFRSLNAEGFRTTFLVFYALSSLVPILVALYLFFQFIRPHLTQSQMDLFADPLTYGLAALLAIPFLGFFLMSWWVKSLEDLTEKIKAKTSEILQDKIEITEKNEIVAVSRHLEGLYKELQTRINQMNDYSRQLMDSQKKLKRMSITDELTTLYNRRYFEKKLVEEVTRSEKAKRPLGLIMIDIDRFKEFNENFGRPEGDKLLRGLGLLIKDHVRSVGLPFRYGGDEFAVLLPRHTVEAAAALAQKLIDAASLLQTTRMGGPREQSRDISIGCGVVSYSSDLKRLFVAADRCLVKARAAGRGKVALYTS